MTATASKVTCLLTVSLFCACVAFTPLMHSRRIAGSTKTFVGDDPFDGWDDTRKANFFEMTLRDLQIEGVPLLGCDADQVHTLQAALWTTMAELVDQDEAGKACLILEQIPIPALQAFVDDFLILRNQFDQMKNLPELNRLTASLVGKGLGPAILLEATAKTEETPTPKFSQDDEYKCSAAMKMFMNRVIIGDANDPASIGLGDEGSANPIIYRSSFSTNVCAALATCRSTSESVAMSLSRRCSLSLVHIHPEYDRSKIEPLDKPAFGHLPPLGWLRPMLKANGDFFDLNDDALMSTNYQRRSPVTAVNIVRNSLLADPKIVTIELESGMMTQASGLEVYCPNALALADTEESVLKEAHQAEIAILS
ncbi:hypothetical protein MHU86_7827 [Fragilaria crotonensis]|nr:hypothetical protein MHU86_7827 [Fragilaria crotonensis]